MSPDTIFSWAAACKEAPCPECLVGQMKLYLPDTQVSLDLPRAPTPAPVDPTEVHGPFMGVAAEIPGTIEAEEYDYGGPGVAYSDTDPGNNGGVRYRSGRADECKCSPERCPGAYLELKSERYANCFGGFEVKKTDRRVM